VRWLLRSAHRAYRRSQGSRVARQGEKFTALWSTRKPPECGRRQGAARRVSGARRGWSVTREQVRWQVRGRCFLVGERRARGQASQRCSTPSRSCSSRVVAVTEIHLLAKQIGTMISKRHTRGWASQGSSTAEQSCAARMAVGTEASSLKAEDHPTLVSKRHTLALSSHQHSTPNQLCPARVVGGAEAGALWKTSYPPGQWPCWARPRGGKCSIGGNLRPNQRFKLTWLSCAKTMLHALLGGSLAKVLPRTRQAA